MLGIVSVLSCWGKKGSRRECLVCVPASCGTGLSIPLYCHVLASIRCRCLAVAGDARLVHLLQPC